MGEYSVQMCGRILTSEASFAGLGAKHHRHLFGCACSPNAACPSGFGFRIACRGRSWCPGVLFLAGAVSWRSQAHGWRRRARQSRLARKHTLAEGNEDHTSFYVTELLGRGKSVVACKNIPAGKRVIEELPLLSLKFTGRADDDLLNVAWCYDRLSQSDKDSIMDLCHLEEPSVGLLAALELYPPQASELPPSMTIEELRRVASKVDCNIIRIVILSSVHEKWTGVESGDVSCAVYQACSRFNHSCEPNIGRRFDADGCMSLHTLRDIEAGEEMTISYLGDAELLQNTERRRWQLQPWGFRCSCPRCEDLVDPTRVFHCTSCGDGLVLAGSQLDDLSGRTCELCSAEMSATCAASSIVTEQSALIELEVGLAALQVTDMSSSHGEGTGRANLNESLVRLEEQIRRFAAHLAPEHWVMAALHDTAQRLCQQVGQLSRAVPHLESKLQFLNSTVAPAQPLPLQLPEWDRETCQDLLLKVQREAIEQAEQHSHGGAH